MVKVHVLQVDRKPENIAELTAGVTAGRTVERWQMPKGAKPSDLVIWYAAGRQKYIAQGWVDAIPTLVKEGPGPYRGPVAGMEWIEPPVDRRKVIRDCGLTAVSRAASGIVAAGIILVYIGVNALMRDIAVGSHKTWQAKPAPAEPEPEREDYS